MKAQKNKKLKKVIVALTDSKERFIRLIQRELWNEIKRRSKCQRKLIGSGRTTGFQRCRISNKERKVN